MDREYDMRDRNYETRDRAYDDRRDYHYDEPYERSSYGYYGRTPFKVTRDYARRRMDYGRRRMDYGRRYDYDSGVLTSEEIQDWEHELHEHMEEREKENFKKERVMKRASELGVTFSDYTPEEFYVVVLMLYLDYKRVVGTSVDSYIQMAKEWFKDTDAALRNSDKLTAYYDYIIMG